MPTDTMKDTPLDEIKRSRRAELLEVAKGNKLSTKSEAVYLLFIAIFFVIVFLDRAHIPGGVFDLFLITVFLQLVHTGRMQKRLKAITELLETN